MKQAHLDQWYAVAAIEIHPPELTLQSPLRPKQCLKDRSLDFFDTHRKGSEPCGTQLLYLQRAQSW